MAPGAGWRRITTVAKPLLLLLVLLLTLTPQAPPASGAGQRPDERFLKLSDDFYVNVGALSLVGGSAPALGLKEVLVIPVYFPDEYPESTIDELNSMMVWAARYFLEASGGRLSISWTFAGGGYWFALPYTSTYYGWPSNGRGDSNWYYLIRDAIEAADPYVDFSRWRYILIIHAGDDEALTGDPYDILSFAVYDIPLWTEEGYLSFSVAVVSESDPLGVVAHELGHNVMLWPDLYDYDYEEEYVGHWGLMGEGLWNGWPQGSSPAHPMAWSKIKAGWIAPGEVEVVLPGEVRVVNLTPHEVAGGVRAVKIPINTLDPYRYFLVEARAMWSFDAWLPGQGVLVTYVDETLGSGRGIVRVVDSTPGDGSVDNGQWLPGQVYYNESLGLRVAVLSVSNYVYTVAVSYRVYPAVAVEPSTAPAGSAIVVRGSGFTPLSLVEVYVDSTLAAVARAGPRGSFEVWIRVPPGAEAGQHYITAVDEYGFAALGYLEVLQPRLSVEYNESTGELVVSASGLGPRMPYAVAVDGLIVYLASSDWEGRLEASLTLPPLAPGAHTVAILHLGPPGAPEPAPVASAVFLASDGAAMKSYVDSRLAELNSTLAALAAAVSGLEARIAGLEAGVEALELTVNHTILRVDTLNATLEALASAVYDLDETLRGLEAALASLEGEVDGLESTLARALEDLQELEARLGALESELNASLDRLNKLDQRLAAAEDDIEELRDATTSLRLELEAVAARVQALAATLNTTSQRLGEAVEELREGLARAAAGLEELNRTLAELTPLPEQLQGLRDALDALAAMLDELDDRVGDVEGTVEDLKADAASLQEDLKDAYKTLGDLEARLAAAEARIDALQEAVKALEELKPLKTEVEALREQAGEASRQAREARQATLTYTLAGMAAAVAIATLAARLAAKT